MQRDRGPPASPTGANSVLLEQIEDRDRALVLDVRARSGRSIPRRASTATRRLSRVVVWLAGSFMQVEPESRPSGHARPAPRPRPASIAAGPSARSCSGPSFRIEVRFMKSSTRGRGEARRARRRQHVVGAADIVADHFRRVPAEEDRAGIADAARAAPRDRRSTISRCSAAMRSASGTASSSVVDQDDRAEIAPARARRSRARGSVVELALDRRLDRVGEAGVVGDQDRLRAGVVLGLRQQVGGDPVRIVAGAVGDDQHLGRTGDHVDADRAEHLPLGGRDIGVAGADDLGDRRDGLGAVGERRDRLRAADAVDLVDAGELGGRQHQRVELAVRRRHHHDDALARRRPSPAPRSSAPRTDRPRCRPARRARPPRSRVQRQPSSTPSASV